MQPTLQPPTGYRPSWAESGPAGQKIGRRGNPQRKQEVNNPGTKSIQVNTHFLAPSSVRLVKGGEQGPTSPAETKATSSALGLAGWVQRGKHDPENQPQAKPPNY